MTALWWNVLAGENSAEEVRACTSVHLTLDHLGPVDVAFPLSHYSNLLHRAFYCGPILLKLTHKSTH
jgi:hypothetical protein